MKHSSVIAASTIAVGFVITAWFYGDLPDPMPTHFGADGKPDNYTALPWGAFIMPLAAIATWLLALLLPVISPKEFSMERFRPAFEIVMLSIVSFLTVTQYILLRSAIDPQFDPSTWIQVLLGVLFLVLANYMTKTEPNFFFGIRTPWTLASKEVWFRTHRQAGYGFAAVGILTLLTAPLESGLVVALGAILLLVIWLVAYSYLAYRRLGATQSTSTPTGQ
jgi:uncharacterized membrane protein